MSRDERDEGAERRMVRVVTDIGCAFFVARAHRRVAPLDDAPFSEDFFTDV